jgi:heme oxygenase
VTPLAKDEHDILARLRAATAADHAAIEAALDVMRPDLTLPRYIALLARFYGFYEPWEAAAGRIDATAAVVAERRKVPMLERDLQALGFSVETMAALPRCATLPSLQNEYEVLGSMYVIEGSTLGGQHVARHVRATLPLPPGVGIAFFSSYGERVGARWREFQGHLRRAAHTGDNLILRSGCETFRLLHNWLLHLQTAPPPPAHAAGRLDR